MILKNKKTVKYIIPSVVVLILIGIIIGYNILPKQALGSIYNISELGDNFDNIQIGDEVNYEINGYNNWQVIGKDDYNGTVDIVSKTNTEDLTLEYGQPKEYYEQKFQEIADKYTDGNYAISARTVNTSDLDYFTYDNDFWLGTISDTSIKTSQATYQYTGENPKIYIVPNIFQYSSTGFTENIGDVVEYSYGGKNRWIVWYKDGQNQLRLIPETPIELVLTNSDNDIYSKANQIYNAFGNYGDWFWDYGNIPNLIPNFLNQQTEKIYILYADSYYRMISKSGNSWYFKPYDGRKMLYSYENGEYVDIQYPTIIHSDTSPYTIGYRPVVTLKVKKELEDENKKEISNSLQVGDYVKYEAKGYKNWKVLRVDENLGTVDIISGGIVKNLTLSGKEDWENYEEIIQKEVDEYKNGSKAKKATTISSKDLKLLQGIDKGLISRYWVLSKNTYINKQGADILNYGIDTIYFYKYANYEMIVDDVIIYVDVVDKGGGTKHYISSKGSYSYTAGLRPVITLKINDVEKTSEEEIKVIEKQTVKQEKVYIKEQEANNKNYNGPKLTDDDSSKVIESNGDNINKNKETDEDKCIPEEKIVEKVVYKDRWPYKYEFFILLIIFIIETVLLLISTKAKIKK